MKDQCDDKQELPPLTEDEKHLAFEWLRHKALVAGENNGGHHAYVAMRSWSELKEQYVMLQGMWKAADRDLGRLGMELTVAQSATPTIEQIKALPRIVPSEMSAEERWRRNSEYVSLYDVLALCGVDRTTKA